MAEEQQQDSQQPAQPIFGVEKVYVKDSSLEVPNAPQIFLQRENPEISIELNNRAVQVDNGIFEAIIKITVTAKIQDKVAFLVEVEQAGIFQIHNVPEENLPAILGIACPNIIFPYARESISDLVTRAGFPPVLLNPVNFEALYAQQLEQQQAAANVTTH